MLAADRVERIVGFGLILTSVLTLIEANKLRVIHGFNHGIGPSTFPFLVGAALAVLGFYFAARGGKGKAIPITLPKGRVARTMIGTMATMIGYGVALPILGYVGGTLLTSVLLFKVIGKYRWTYCILLGVTITGLLYLLFIYGVMLPFPKGLIWDII